MKKILSKITNKVHIDNRGMSLVEILCAVAILALISGVIGSVIVISTRTYSRGVTETNIQQEAQLAANNIGDIVRDACGVLYAESGANYYKDGELMKDGTGNVVTNENSYTELTISTNDKKKYTVKYYSSSGELKYEVIDSGTSPQNVSEQLMAKNISRFKAHTEDFKDNKSIKLEMTVTDGDREIPMEYTMTSRNGAGEGVTFTPVAERASIAIEENEIVLVPGQTYSVPFSVWGGIQQDELRWTSSTNFEVNDFKIGVENSETHEIDGTAGSVSVKVPIDTSEKSVLLTFKAVDSAGTEKAKADLTVHVRKVEQVKVNYSVNADDTDHGTVEEEKAEYTFSANVSGNRLAQDTAYDYDKGYVTAEAVVWSVKIHTGDKTVKTGEDTYTDTDIVRDWICTENAGKWEFAPDYSVNSVDFNKDESDTDRNKTENTADAFNTAIGKYIEITGEEGDVVLPKLTIKFKRSMPVDFSLTVRATSKHALGANKADSAYGNRTDSAYYGEAVITPRPTLVKGAKYVVLEPGEDIKIDDFKMLGAGMPGNVEIDYSNGRISDTRSGSGTEATYDPTDRSVTVHVGMDERGSKIGTETQEAEIIDEDGEIKKITKTVDTWDYNVYVNLKTDGNIIARIIVCVSRIDYMSLEREDPPLKKGESGESGSDKSYRFNVRFNTLSEGKLKSRLRYLTFDEEHARINLATKFTITYKDTAADKLLETTEVIIDGAGNVINESGEVSSSDKYKKEGWEKEYSLLVTSSLGTEMNSDTNGSDTGYEFINPSSTPHVFVSPTKDELPMNRRLTVRAEIMHPRGLNNAGSAYYDSDYEKDGHNYWDTYLADEKFFEGPKGIEVDEDVIVVEPGQKLEIPVSAPAEMEITPILGAHSGKTATPKLEGKGEKRKLIIEFATDEKGVSDTGAVKVTLKPKKGDSKTITFLLRRVNKVEWKDNHDLIIEKREDASKKNVKGQQVMLKVNLNGYRNITVETDDGEKVTVDPFEKQKVEYDPYMSPYEIKWEMGLLNPATMKTETKPLLQWTDYFEEVKQGREGEIQTIKFKLKKQLPSGTKIRAYSLHALGEDEGKKYNKSQKEYDGEVYAELEISRLDIAAECGFERYNEHNYDLPGYEKIPNYEGADTHWSDQQVFYRYRKVGGAWSQYYREDEGSGFKPQIDGGKMGKVFRTDTEYELDYVFVVFNQSEKKIYWPLDDETLLAPGMGFKERGFSYADWDYKNLLSDEQKNFKCRQEYFIAKTELFVAPYPDPERYQTGIRKTIPKRTGESVGTEKKPILVDGNGNGTQEKWFSVNMDPSAFCLHAYQGHFYVLVDKKTSNGWESVNLGNMQNTEHWLATAQNPEITAGYTYGAKGTYRLRAYIDTIEWQKPSGDMFYPTYVTDSTESMNLYDDSGRGTIYVKFE